MNAIKRLSVQLTPFPSKADAMQDVMTTTDFAASPHVAKPSRKRNNSLIPPEFLNDSIDGGRERAALATVFGVREYTEPKVLWERQANEALSHSTVNVLSSGFPLDQLPSFQTCCFEESDMSLMGSLEHFKLPDIPVVSEFDDLLNPDSCAVSERNGRAANKAVVDHRLFDLLGSNSDERIIIWDLDPNAISASLATTQHVQSIQDTHAASSACNGFSSNKTLSSSPPPPPAHKHRPRFPAHLFSMRRVTHPAQRWRSLKSNEETQHQDVPPSATPGHLPRVIGAATVEKLVEKLTDTLDYTLMTDFFLTYRSFISSVQLCHLLILRFRWSLESEDETHSIARVRTFVVLRHWLLNYFVHDFIPCRELRIVLTSFLNALPYHPLVKDSSKNRRIVKSLKRVVRRLKKIYFQGSADDERVQVIAPPPPTSAQERVEEIVRATLSQSTIRRKTAIIGGINVGNRHNGNIAVHDPCLAPVVVIGNTADGYRDAGPSMDIRLPSRLIGRGNTYNQKKAAKQSFEQRPDIQTPSFADDKRSVSSSTMVSSSRPALASRRSSVDTCDASLKSAVSPGTTEAYLESECDGQSSYSGEEDPSLLGSTSRRHEQQITEQLTARLEYERQRLEEEEERKRAAFFSPLENEDASEPYDYQSQGYSDTLSRFPSVPALHRLSQEQTAFESSPITPSTLEMFGQQDPTFPNKIGGSLEPADYLSRNRFSKTLVEDDSKSLQQSARLREKNHYTSDHHITDNSSILGPPREGHQPLPLPPLHGEGADMYQGVEPPRNQGGQFVKRIAEALRGDDQQLDELNTCDCARCTGNPYGRHDCQRLSALLWQGGPERRRSMQLQAHRAVSVDRFGSPATGAVESTTTTAASPPFAEAEKSSTYNETFASLEAHSLIMALRQPDPPSPPFPPKHARSRTFTIHTPIMTHSGPTEGPLYRRSFLLNYRSRQIAEQFCLIERDVLLNVDWEEMVHCGWTRLSAKGEDEDFGRQAARDRKNGVEQVIKRFNAVCEWVSSEIVRTALLEERVKVIEKLIRLAQKCRQFSNYATLVQILLGLQSPSVTRLAKTWARVDRREKALLEELSVFTSPVKNWKHIRDDMTDVAEEFGMSPTEIQIEMPGTNKVRQARIKLPFGGCVPFLGIYLSDLVFNSEQPKHLEPVPAKRIYHAHSTSQSPLFHQPLVNFRKYRVIATVIKRVLTLQNLARRYSFEREEGLYTQCCYLDALDADATRQLSLDIEPS